MSESETSKGPEGIAPFALAMVICDAAWRDPTTGKYTLLGCFSTVAAKEFPVKLPAMTVYIAVTDGHGKVPLSIRLVDVDDEQPPVFELKGECTFTDPRVILEVVFGVMNAVFPSPGEYRLQLYAGSHAVMERRIVLSEMGAKTNGPDSES